MQTTYEFTRQKIKNERRAIVRRVALVLAGAAAGMGLNYAFGVLPVEGSGLQLLLDCVHASLLPGVSGVAVYLTTR